MHYSLHLDEQFTVVFMTVSHSAQMLLKLEKCIPISPVTLEMVPKYANIERPTSSQLYASPSYSNFPLPPQACITEKPSKCEAKIARDNEREYQFLQ